MSTHTTFASKTPFYNYVCMWYIIANLFLPFAGVNLERVLKVQTSL